MSESSPSVSCGQVSAAARTDPRPVVGAAILDQTQAPTALLAARRSAPSSLAGQWEFPGGKVEPGEQSEAALVREVREELGVELCLLEELATDHPAGWLLGNGARMRVFTAVICAGEARPLEDHDLLDWVALEHGALHGLEWIPADRPIVDALLAMLRR